VISNSSLRFMVFRAVTPELDRELRPRLPLEKKIAPLRKNFGRKLIPAGVRLHPCIDFDSS
jgi:hypothetical protein